MIEWYKRWKRTDTQMAERRTLQSRCGHYKVEESNIKYGRTYKRNGDYNGYPILYRAMVLMDWGWWIISSHKKPGTAQKACEYFHDKGHVKPKPKKKRKKVRVDES